MFKRIAAALLCVLTTIGLTGCQEKTPSATITLDAAKPSASTNTERETEPMDGQLIASVQTREEAEKIAALYGIELVDFAAPAALYATEEDPQTVIQRGMDNGWPLLEINHTKELY